MTQAEKGDTENGKEKGGEKEKEQRGVKRPIVPALVPESLQEVRCGMGVLAVVRPRLAWASAAVGAEGPGVGGRTRGPAPERQFYPCAESRGAGQSQGWGAQAPGLS